MVIPLDRSAAIVSQEIVMVEDKDDLNHRIQVAVGHTIGENKASEHRSGIIRIVYMNITSGGTIGNWHVVFCVSVCRCFVVYLFR